MKPGADIAANITPEEADLLHAAVGVSGEAAEILDACATSIIFDVPLDQENMVEELGDIEFYIEALRQNRNIDRAETLYYVGDRPPLTIGREASMLSIASGHLLDAVKKVVVYKKPVVTKDICTSLASIERVLEHIRGHLGVTRDESLAGNIAKLSVRYAGITYSDTAAQVRADKA